MTNTGSSLCLLLPLHLIHLPLDKIAFSQTIVSDAFSWMKSSVFWEIISLNSVPKGPIDNNSALVQIMARHRIGNKSYSEPVLTWFIDAYIRHLGEMI